VCIEVGASIDLDEEDEEDLDDGDVFVEIKTARFPRTLGLPLPEDLR
jgi:hypothetical protein